MGAEKILIVDDEERNIQLIEAMLMNEAYELARAGSGEDALEQAIRNPPDLILLDVMMAGMNGMEACRRLKAIETLKRVPVVMVTALREMKHRVMAMEAGADDFICKPIDQTELLVRVKSLLRIKRYQDDLLESRCEIAEKNRRLQELEKVKEGLIHMVVHDMNNPLTVMSGSVDLLLMDEERLAGRHLELVEKCRISCQDLLLMIKELLDIYRMEQAQLRLDVQPIDWRELVEDARTRFEIKARAKRVALSCRANVLAAVRVDRGLMGRVLGNLIQNALRYAPEGGRVECRSTQDGPARPLRCEVRDNGPGLDPEYHERVFNKFEQVKMRQSGVNGSAGLGLAFCKMAVEAHGGRIWVESAGRGTGCAFKFEIPMEPR
jgi:signal transduction histidine kinase